MIREAAESGGRIDILFNTILAGVVKNERLVLGDQGDILGSKTCFNPDFAGGVDDYLLDVARRRRSGETAV
jgi:hypothetical protein